MLYFIPFSHTELPAFRFASPCLSFMHTLHVFSCLSPEQARGSYILLVCFTRIRERTVTEYMSHSL